MKVRRVITFKNYFKDFLDSQPSKIKAKIYKILEAIETNEILPANYLKHLTGTKGIYEARVKLGSNTWRIFCFFDEDKLVILMNGFQKKTQKTPKNEIEKAIRIRNEYYNYKKLENGNTNLGTNKE